MDVRESLSLISSESVHSQVCERRKGGWSGGGMGQMITVLRWKGDGEEGGALSRIG